MLPSRALFAGLAVVALSAVEPRIHAQPVSPNGGVNAARVGEIAVSPECASVAKYFDDMATNVKQAFEKLEADVRANMARATPREVALLQRELASLKAEEAKMLATLADQRAASLDACGKGVARERARRLAVHRALAAFCGAAPSPSPVVVVVGGATGKSAVGEVGHAARVSGASLVAAGVGQALSHARASRGSAPVLVVDDAEPVLREPAARDAHLASLAAGYALAAEPGVVVLRTSAPLTAQERALAAARGWRVAGEGPNAIRMAACGQ